MISTPKEDLEKIGKKFKEIRCKNKTFNDGYYQSWPQKGVIFILNTTKIIWQIP